MVESGRQRRISRGTIVLLVFALLVLLAGVIPSPYIVERPGPVVNTLGDLEIDGEDEPVLELVGVDTHETDGAFNLVSVTMLGSPERPLKWLSLLWPLVDPAQAIVPQDEVFAPGVTSEDRDRVNAELMGSSQVLAAVAALGALGDEVPVTLTVADVVGEGPADGVLRKGDVLREVHGRPVESMEMLRRELAETPSEASAELVVERSGERRWVDIVPERLEESGDPMIGVSLAIEYDVPFEINMSMEDIGGPSAGSIFALAIYDRLTEGELTGGKSVSGTGTVSAEGKIGAIGGLPQKIWAAARADSDLFLMPVANCSDVPDRLPGDLPIVPVDSLDEAIDAVELAADGGKLPSLERCEAAS